VDVRLVSATHQPLEARISDGGFREDLFYRLNVFPIVLAPLRERPGDIRELAVHFLEQLGRAPGDLSDDAVARLSAYTWPGNIRELRNVLERATILRPHGVLEAADILITDAAAAGGAPAPAATSTLNLAEVEQDLIRRALDAAGGNKSEAARLLGITRRALYGRLERYGIDPGEDDA